VTRYSLPQSLEKDRLIGRPVASYIEQHVDCCRPERAPSHRVSMPASESSSLRGQITLPSIANSARSIMAEAIMNERERRTSPLIAPGAIHQEMSDPKHFG